MKVLLTGSSGFIGRHVLNLLKGSEHHVFATGRETQKSGGNVEFLKCDLLDRDQREKLFENTRFDALIHLAWYAEHGKFWTAPENLDWVEASVDLVKKFTLSGGKKVVLAGTCAEYSHDAGYCVEGASQTEPSTLYGVAKDATRRVLQQFCGLNETTFYWGRIFFPYGPGEAEKKLIPSVIKSSMAGGPVLCSHGEQYRDFLFVEDVASAFVSLLGYEGASGVYNISSGEPVKLKDVVGLCLKGLDSRSEAQFGAIPVSASESSFLVGDNSRLKKTGWQRKVSLEEGLKRYIESMNERSE